MKALIDHDGVYSFLSDAWKNPKERELKALIDHDGVYSFLSDAWKNPKERELKDILSLAADSIRI